MKDKKICVYLSLAAVMLVNIAGCSEADNNNEITTNEITTNEITTTGTEKWTTDEAAVEDDIVTKTEQKADGSISVVSTDSAGRVVETIDYDAGNDTTIKYIYEYNENGTLISQYDYEGSGNLIDQFAAGNYDNATMMGENHYDDENDYDVDIEHAFDVTIEELAPLYHKAEEIWDMYGVAVLIADKVSDNTDGAEMCCEYEKIERSLKLIESCLACYPDNFFRDFSDGNETTNICIQVVGTGSHAGVYMGGNKYLIVQIDVNDYCPEEGYDDEGTFFCYTLHHELFHMISDKLMDRAAQSECPLTEEQWNSYNPDGFQYVGYYDDGKASELYTSAMNSEYFVYSYSCSTPDEDRAIIFGNAMTYYQGLDFNVYNDYIDAKLRYLSECMRAGFNSDGWQEKMPWDYILDE